MERPGFRCGRRYGEAGQLIASFLLLWTPHSSLKSALRMRCTKVASWAKKRGIDGVVADIS